MATSIVKAKQTQATVESKFFGGSNDEKLKMCDLVDATMDELVNISGADCPQRLPELRTRLTALSALKAVTGQCSARAQARRTYCGKKGWSTYFWVDEKGEKHSDSCHNDRMLGIRG